MANEYATIDQVKQRLENKVTDAQETELGQMLEAASRAVDDYLNVSQAFFTPPTGNTSKVLRGQGMSFLDLPTQLGGTVTITAEAGITIPNFTVDGLRLITLDSNDLPSSWIIWRDSVYYTVNGSWGYAAIPAQIREATLQLTVHFWRGKDKALTGTIMDMRQDEQFPERDYPRMTRRILDQFAYNLPRPSAGGSLVLV